MVYPKLKYGCRSERDEWLCETVASGEPPAPQKRKFKLHVQACSDRTTVSLYTPTMTHRAYWTVQPHLATCVMDTSVSCYCQSTVTDIDGIFCYCEIGPVRCLFAEWCGFHIICISFGVVVVVVVCLVFCFLTCLSTVESILNWQFCLYFKYFMLIWTISWKH